MVATPKCRVRGRAAAERRGQLGPAEGRGGRRDLPDRGAFQHAVRAAVRQAADRAAGRVRGAGPKARRGQRDGIGHGQVAAAAGEYRVGRRGRIQFGAGGQPVLGQVGLVPRHRGHDPGARGGVSCRRGDQGGELGDAAGPVYRHQQRVAAGLHQVLVCIGEGGQQGQVTGVGGQRAGTGQVIETVRLGRGGRDLGAAQADRAVYLAGHGVNRPGADQPVQARRSAGRPHRCGGQCPLARRHDGCLSSAGKRSRIAAAPGASRRVPVRPGTAMAMCCAMRAASAATP